MCLLCVLFSAIELFTPVTASLQAANLTPADVSSPAYSQVNSSKVAVETRSAISQMVAQLPDSPDMRVLRQELLSLKAQLAAVKDDAEADKTINEGLRSMNTRIMAQPNAGQIVEYLKGMLVDDSQPPANSSGLKLLKSKHLNSLSLNGKSNTWGWLH
jgi:hypothetical protein